MSGNAARALGVPSGDLRKLVLVDQRLADAALEAVELRLDDAEANLCEALHCGDPRRRDAVSMFMLRNTQRAAKRGYAVAASAASLEVGLGDRAPPQTTSFGGPKVRSRDGDDRARRERRLQFRDMTNGRGDGCLEGEVATPAVLIEHAAAVGFRASAGCSHRRWKLCRLCLNRSPPPSVTSASGSRRGFAPG